LKLFPISVTLSGIVMFVRLLQPLKADLPMTVTLSPMVMLVRLAQKEKALSPMLVTLSGIVMLVRRPHKEKALSPMLVTDLPSIVVGMVNAPDDFLLQPVMMTPLSFTSYFKLELTGASAFVGFFGEDFAIASSFVSLISLTGRPPQVSPQPFASGLR